MVNFLWDTDANGTQRGCSRRRSLRRLKASGLIQSGEIFMKCVHTIALNALLLLGFALAKLCVCLSPKWYFERISRNRNRQ